MRPLREQVTVSQQSILQAANCVQHDFCHHHVISNSIQWYDLWLGPFLLSYPIHHYLVSYEPGSLSFMRTRPRPPHSKLHDLRWYLIGDLDELYGVKQSVVRSMQCGSPASTKPYFRQNWEINEISMLNPWIQYLQSSRIPNGSICSL